MRFFVLLVALGAVLSQPTGFRMSFTEAGLSQFQQSIIELINADFQDIPLPNMNFDHSVPVLGAIEITLENIKINSFKLPMGSINTIAPSDVAIAFVNTYIQVDLDFHWRKKHWPHISDHGHLTATPEQGNVNAQVALSPDAQGHVVITPSSVSVDFDKVKLHFSGHWDSWLYNLFTDLFSKVLRDTLNKAVTGALQNILKTTINNVLQKIPTSIYLGGGETRTELAIGVNSIAAKSNVFIEIGLPVTVTDVASGTVCPLPAVPLPASDPQANQLQFFLSQTPLDCALWVAYKNGALSPPPLKSNTDQWLLIAPALTAKYPGAALSVALTPAELPMLNISAQGAALGAGYYMSLTVEETSGNIPNVLVFGVGAAIGLDVSIGPSPTNSSDLALLASVTKLSLQLNVASSQVGPVSTSGIDALLNLITPIIKDTVNKALANGFPIPLAHGITLESPQILFFEQYLAVAANIAFNP